MTREEFYDNIKRHKQEKNSYTNNQRSQSRESFYNSYNNSKKKKETLINLFTTVKEKTVNPVVNTFNAKNVITNSLKKYKQFSELPLTRLKGYTNGFINKRNKVRKSMFFSEKDIENIYTDEQWRTIKSLFQEIDSYVKLCTNAINNEYSKLGVSTRVSEKEIRKELDPENVSMPSFFDAGSTMKKIALGK